MLLARRTLLLAAPLAAAPPPPAAIETWPRPLHPGAAVLVTLKAPSSAHPAADWHGHPLAFHYHQPTERWRALAGLGYETKPGRYPLAITDGETPLASANLTVAPHAYPVSRITVPPRYIDPPRSEKERIAADQALKKKVFAAASPNRLWQRPFAAPARTVTTSPYGARRTYNGKTRSIHLGLDYRAATGTPILAANDGIVVLARPMYYEGGLVIIDHGETWFTLYMHLSEFTVTEGQRVTLGDPIAKSGATGRVTGPHLHFAVRWQGLYLSPATLLALPLA